MSRIREEHVRTAVLQSLKRSGYELRCEFPLVGRVADIFGVHVSSGVTVAVECKERDWSKAIRQARAYQGAADLVYVALPRSRASEKAKQALACYGLGLLVVD